jgi:DNA polymerase/3'-5' exonuclease PolX
MNPLVTSLISQRRENDSQSNTSSYENSKKNLEQKTLENETLLKWLKRQNLFKINQTIDNIISALIRIGRVDLAYMFKVENLRNQCENL